MILLVIGLVTRLTEDHKIGKRVAKITGDTNWTYCSFCLLVSGDFEFNLASSNTEA